MNALERRAVKRGRIVEIVKGKEEYLGASQQVKDACPDPSDHSITKRQSERVFRAWRAVMKALKMRAEKRGRIVEIVKGTEEYHGASQQVKDACPDPSDHSITKGQWEGVFRAWRADLKASIMLVDSPSGDAPSTREADEHQDSEAI